MMMACALAVAPVESWTWTVNADGPAAEGIPEIIPLPGEIPSPAGTAPAVMLHEYGATPPATAKEVEYSVPTTPWGCAPPIRLSGGIGATMLMVWFEVTVKGFMLESVTCTVKVVEPADTGMPDTTPVVGSIERPVGRDPVAMLILRGAVPPAAVIDVLYPMPTVPCAGAPLREGSGFTVMLTSSSFLVPGTEARIVSWMGAVIPAGAV
jgi:hypothetical protein